MTESQPWDDEPEIKDETETETNVDTDESGDETGSAGGMFIVAVTLSMVVPIWAVFGPVPKPVLYLAGLWIMAATIATVAEVYAA